MEQYIMDWKLPESDIVHEHHFPDFFNDDISCLFLGTFPGKEFTHPDYKYNPEDWFYSASGNTFWDLMFYSLGNAENEIRGRKSKEAILENNAFGITDIIEKAQRIRNSNQDSNLYVTQIKDLRSIVERCSNLKTIFLTSISMFNEFFIPAYADKNGFLILNESIKEKYSFDKEYIINKYIYSIKHSSRIIRVIPLHSPAREIPPYEIKKELYKKIITSEYDS